ncbi:hypothetical protein ES703_58604 [subsurface metagenome]
MSALRAASKTVASLSVLTSRPFMVRVIASITSPLLVTALSFRQ